MSNAPDEAKARSGKDPHPKIQPAGEEPSRGVKGIDGEPAVVFGGALATPSNAVQPTGAASASASAGTPPTHTIDILV